MGKFEVALEALIQDAVMWDHVSVTIRQASREAAGLTLGEEHLSWAAKKTDLLSTYSQIQGKVQRLLEEATKATRDISFTLDEVNRIYRTSDQESVDLLKGAWSVRD